MMRVPRSLQERYLEVKAARDELTNAAGPHELLRAMPRLDARSQLVLRRLYLDRKSQREIATEIGVSQMQVSRLHGRALADLRRSMEGAGT
jgi:RNA polymerase sigma factor (sigma-70 family)